MDTLNSNWDTVYAANTLHEHPLKMLETIWPYVHSQVTQADLPDIDAKAIFRVIHRRKPQAAPGLDGWRTLELQSLPISGIRSRRQVLSVGREYLWGRPPCLADTH